MIFEEDIREKLKNVYFINGTAYAGKSTVVKLLAEKYDGIACRENYHDVLSAGLSKEEFPCLTYIRDMENWSDFATRTPDEYEAWINGSSEECTVLELRILKELAKEGKKIFVDTNITLEVLRRISDTDRVLIMLADPETSVKRFFERPDKEKQFLYQVLLHEPDPEAAMENFRRCLERINSKENYSKFLHSGFNVLLRDEGRTAQETLALAEELFKLILIPNGTVKS